MIRSSGTYHQPDQKEAFMARRVEEIKRVRRSVSDSDTVDTDTDRDRYEEEYYDVGDTVPEETGLNTASGILALVLLALAIYLIWAALT
jgi:hypothetical protein